MSKGLGFFDAGRIHFFVQGNLLFFPFFFFANQLSFQYRDLSFFLTKFRFRIPSVFRQNFQGFHFLTVCSQFRGDFRLVVFVQLQSRLRGSQSHSNLLQGQFNVSCSQLNEDLPFPHRYGEAFGFRLQIVEHALYSSGSKRFQDLKSLW